MVVEVVIIFGLDKVGGEKGNRLKWGERGRGMMLACARW